MRDIGSGVGLSESDSTKIAVMSNDMKYLKEAIDKIDTKVSMGYVTKDEFDPIRRVVYGLIGLILVAVVGSLLALILR